MSLLKYFNKNNKILSLPHDFNEELIDIPEETQQIIFCQNYNNKEYSIFNNSVDNLPKNLTHLTLAHSFNQSVDNLPLSLTHLTFHQCFNQPIDNLPSSLTHLMFDSKFSYIFSHMPIANNLGHPDFGKSFNQSVDKLPQNLTHLSFGTEFNQSVNNLPESLICLTFGYAFNQSVDNLPKNLTHLTFGCLFNEKVDNLPKNLIYLDFQNQLLNASEYNNDYYYETEYGLYSIAVDKLIDTFLTSRFDQPLENLPEKLRFLSLPLTHNNKIIVPKNIKQLYLSCKNNTINNLPEYVKTIFINFYYNENNNNYVNNLPITIKEVFIKHKNLEKFIKTPFETEITIIKDYLDISKLFS